MPSWFDKLFSRKDSADTTLYRAVRSASNSWFPKVMAHPVSTSFEIVRAAKALKLTVEDRTIVFEDESEQAVLMDYYLVDFRPQGRSLLESCTFAPGKLSALETAYHEAMLTSYGSLFEVSAVHDHEPKALLRDRLNKQAQEFWLTDIGLSDSFRRLGNQTVLYTRIVTLQGLHITGGYSFGFDPKHTASLLEGYERALWSVPAAKRSGRRTGHFLAQQRRFGLPQAYADVVPSGQK